MHPPHSLSAARPQGVFSNNQPVYAEHGVATFPVTQDKIPAIRGYSHVGLPGSAKLAQKFPSASALGFIAGRRSRITVLDVDTTDEKVLSDALARHGASNVIIRTGSGKWHAYYRWGGERRRIRPHHGLPIDIIGGGVAIAPPSLVVKGGYEIIQGTLDDLDRLPLAKGLNDSQPQPKSTVDRHQNSAVDGRRNITMWEHLMRSAKSSCDNLNAVIDAGRSYNEKCLPPLGDDEVVEVATKAWKYTERGMNMFGGHGVVFSAELYDELLDGDQDGLILLGFLRGNNLPWAKFMCTNALAEKFGWRVQRLAGARRRLIELGHLVQVKRAWRRSPALFEFPIKHKGTL
jgi:Bifunctional DNA primase/polymerase, N-terminal